MKNDELQEVKKDLITCNLIHEEKFKKYFFDKFPEKVYGYYRYYLTDLYKNNILYRYDTDLLKPCGDKKDFIFSLPIDDVTKSKLESINPPIDISIWQLSDLKIFMSLQSFVNIIFVETYYYAIDVVTNILISSGKNVVTEEDYATIVKYNRFDEIYVIKKINEDSPIGKRSAMRNRSSDTKTMIVAPKLEKVIVDLLVDDLINTVLSDETYSILCELLKHFKINMATVKRYATKKHRWGGVMFAIKSTGFNIETGEIK